MSDFKADFLKFLEYPRKINELRARFITNMKVLNVDVEDNELLNTLIDKVSEEYIQTGIKPEGEAYITSNGTFDVTQYATVLVDVAEGLALPTLNAPTISRSSDTLTISNPSTNGNYKQGFKIYNDLTLMFSQTATTISLKTLEPGVYDLKATCYGDNFIESPHSNLIHAEVYTIDYDITELTKSTSEIKISDGVTHSSILTASNGWWLPEKIELYINNELVPETSYTWNMYTGRFDYAAKGDMLIIANALEEPILKRPEIEFSGLITNELTVSDIKYAMWYDVFVNDVQAGPFEYDDESLLAEVLATPAVDITSKFVCTIDNKDYVSNKTYNITWEVYVDDVLLFSEKEGI